MNLKNQLLKLKELSVEEISNINLEVLTEQMLENIGDVNPELRDHLIYSTFCRFIGNKLIDYTRMENILETCISSEYLFYKIGEEKSDSVFTRSFSALCAQLVLHLDIKEKFLPSSLADQAIQCSFHYLLQEKDVRGYVEDKGWAHSIAHGADLVTTAILHPAFQSAYIPDALQAILSCLLKNGVYTDDEDERLIFAIEALLDNGMSDEILGNWVGSVSDNLHEVFKKEGFSFHFYRIKTNIMNFLKSLYFRLGYIEYGEISRGEIQSVLKKWHDAVYKR
ncbi:DUF2785 domain-containing protein [Bacillus sp. FJAT-49736]|uniref:DUF2785 domain-containing protein n=1 Tax=Bacillus sp. FJAT-49736 TaxID=2833582 RepID=UPI001BC9402C|nr:DUF2785 domain-containing protein [Bacillus sp. FJAT-49736]MBS4173525.1 DUF2785 domain-containing protein [Bacillus sp. FJAT-49736]MBS4175915.1 DUF2785 domain-containing protein [Bacillus sp. FJAT-49736]